MIHLHLLGPSRYILILVLAIGFNGTLKPVTGTDSTPVKDNSSSSFSPKLTRFKYLLLLSRLKYNYKLYSATGWFKIEDVTNSSNANSRR